MTNTVVIPRNHLIFGLCLPLAVLIGYFLAEPLDSGSIAVVVMVLCVLSAPLMMRWHHPLLIIAWNAAINPFFLPGRPYLWMVMAAVSLFFGVLNRAVNPAMRFLYVPSVTHSLVFLGGVVGVTALVTGGFGVRSLGSETYGGKGYFFILAAIMGYFAFTSQAIPANRAKWYVTLFFLPGLTAIVSNLAYFGGTGYYFLFDLFPPEFALEQAMKDWSLNREGVRISGATWASQAIWCLLLCRYGIRGMLDWARPWRLVAVCAAVFGGLFGGFRSSVIFFALTFVIQFFVEGLWRTRFLWVLLSLGLLGGGLTALFVDRLPLSAQRALSFLPLRVDPLTRLDAEGSMQWRLDMWVAVFPDVPKYLFKGKGYSIDPVALYLIEESMARGYVRSYEVAMLSGSYHNGPLSVLIPFGIYGAIAFIWFLVAALRVLYLNHRFGDPDLQRINTFLLALFAARTVFFFVAFGSFYSDLYSFTGLLGLSVALNSGVRHPPPKEETGPLLH